jgi:hypothetical protein
MPTIHNNSTFSVNLLRIMQIIKGYLVMFEFRLVLCKPELDLEGGIQCANIWLHRGWRPPCEAPRTSTVPVPYLTSKYDSNFNNCSPFCKLKHLTKTYCYYMGMESYSKTENKPNACAPILFMYISTLT